MRRQPSPVSPLAASRPSLIDGVLRSKRPLDEQLEGRELDALEERDRALVRAIVATVVRRLGTLRHLLAGFLERGLPPNAPRLETALLIGSAQILFLDVPTMLRSIFRCGWCRRIASPSTMPR